MVSSLIALLTDLNIVLALIPGSILGGMSSAVVIGLARQLKLNKNSESILVVEFALSDVFTLAIPIALITTYKSGEIDVPMMGIQMRVSLIIALLLGCAGALLWSIILKKIRTIENTNFTTAAFVFIIYGFIEPVGFSGPIAALAFGITPGNIDHLRLPFIDQYISHQSVSLNQEEKNFFSEMVFPLRTFFFLYIGAGINFANFPLMLLGLGITCILFIMRVPIVMLSVSKKVTKRDASFMAVMIPKGLGAEVLASLPLQEGIPGGDAIQTITFSIILSTTLITTILVFFIEKIPFVRKMYYRLFNNYESGVIGQQG